MSSFDPNNLPIHDVLPEIKNHLEDKDTLIINAPPGAGKSTLVPVSLLDQPWLKDKKIIMLEPRRLATKTLARFIAKILNEEVGETVGYRIRFETNVGPNTRIEVVTEGVLTRMLHADNALDGIGAVIFDEFHERSIHADLALALCRESQSILRPDLKIVIMSATLNTPVLEPLLSAPSVVSEGRQYDVQTHYLGDSDATLIVEMTSQGIQRAVKEVEFGDALVFLPGQREIKDCEAILRKRLPQFEVHPLFGQLPWNKQYAAIMPSKSGKRKIVLATTIAETSLTIEGITIVVDSGFTRNSRFDPRSGLSRLVTEQVTRDSADQRRGRAGRLGPGHCYRLWTEMTHNGMSESRKPEIETADLANLLLDLAKWGIADVSKLSWVSPPPSGHLAQAMDLMEKLGLLEDGHITQHGIDVHQLPCHPRIGHMLVMSRDEGNEALACDIAAVLEERDPLPKESGIDINLRIEALRRHRFEGRTGRSFSKIEKISESYRKLLRISSDEGVVDPYETGLLLAYAYPERIAHSRPGNNAQFKLANGRIVVAGHKDDLAHEPWLAVAHAGARDGLGKIWLASSLNPQDLAPMVKTVKTVEWSDDAQKVVANLDLRIGNIVLQSTPMTEVDDGDTLKALIKYIQKVGSKAFNVPEKAKALQLRVSSLRIWEPDLNLPDLRDSTPFEENAELIYPYLSGVRSAADLRKINFLEILSGILTYESQKVVDRLAPHHIMVPSGSKIELEYQPDGADPVLKVRLQELFGLKETPRLNQGKQSVLIHLLSPGYKVVQITNDLTSFWSEAYFEVRKDLRRRYPKHFWPEDPISAEAVRGVKR